MRLNARKILGRALNLPAFRSGELFCKVRRTLTGLKGLPLGRSGWLVSQPDLELPREFIYIGRSPIYKCWASFAGATLQVCSTPVRSFGPLKVWGPYRPLACKGGCSRPEPRLALRGWAVLQTTRRIPNNSLSIPASLESLLSIPRAYLLFE
jgi:hypothetical protein